MGTRIHSYPPCCSATPVPARHVYATRILGLGHSGPFAFASGCRLARVGSQSPDLMVGGIAMIVTAWVIALLGCSAVRQDRHA